MVAHQEKILSGALRSQRIARAGNSRCLGQVSGAFCVNVFARKDTGCTRLTVSADSPGRPVCFAVHRQPLFWNFLCHSRIVLSVGGSLWCLVRNLRCSATVDSVLANSKTQSAFSSSVLAKFRHDCPLAVKPASAPWRLLRKQTWRDSIPIDILLSAVCLLVVALQTSEIPEARILIVLSQL
jgi:hypothetical protein